MSNQPLTGDVNNGNGRRELSTLNNEVEINTEETKEHAPGSEIVDSSNHGMYRNYDESDVMSETSTDSSVRLSECDKSNDEPFTSIPSLIAKKSGTLPPNVADETAAAKTTGCSHTEEIDPKVVPQTDQESEARNIEGAASKAMTGNSGSNVIETRTMDHPSRTSAVPYRRFDHYQNPHIEQQQQQQSINGNAAHQLYQNMPHPQFAQPHPQFAQAYTVSHPQFAQPHPQFAQPHPLFAQPHTVMPHPPPSTIPSIMHARHHAAEAAAAAAVAAAQKHSHNLQLAKESGATMTRNQLPSNVAAMNHVQKGSTSTTGPAAQINHYVAPNARMNNFQNNHHHEGINSKAPPEVIDVDDEDEQKQRLIQHYTAAIARQLASTDASASAVPQDLQGTIQRRPEFHGEFQNSQNERKRSASVTIDHGTHKRTVARNQSLPNQGGSIAHTNRTNYSSGQQAPDSSVREVNVDDAMSLALEAAISSAHSTSNTSTQGHRVDTPMKYLVRQLLGQVQVLGDEPAVVLAPALVKDAAQKIRLVINKLIEMILLKARTDAESKIREAEARFVALGRGNFTINRDKASDVTQYKSMQALKGFAEEKCQQLRDRDKHIEQLRRQLEAQDREIENSKIRQNVSSHATLNLEKKSNSTMRHLITKLDEGMTTIQRQRKEIEDLKVVRDRESNAVQVNHNMTSIMNTPLFTLDAQQGASNSPQLEVLNQEIESLKTKNEQLHATLQAERQQNEITLKSYMRAAVHALKIQSGELQE